MSPPSSSDTKSIPTQDGVFGLLTSRTAAGLLVAIFCFTFYAFKSNTLIGDGLRYLPALRTITQGATASFQPKPWLEVYRNHYEDLVVHNHFLFGAVMRAAFALQQELGIPGDAIVAMHAVNALSGAVAGGLFFLLGVRVGVPKWISLALTGGLCLSSSYLLAATNVAEAALALPFFVGTLLLLANRPFDGWTPQAVGVFAGLAAIIYLLAGSLVPCIVAAVMAVWFPSRSVTKPLLLFLSTFGVFFFGIWVTVLAASGFHNINGLLGAILQFPQQGTYGGFKLGSLVATPVGLTEAFIPVLPDNFTGLRSLLQDGTWRALYVGAATLIVSTFLALVFYILFKRGIREHLLVLSCLLTFLLVEAACVQWDAYYQKLHVFAVILCWVMVAIALSERQTAYVRWPMFLFVGLVIASGFRVLEKNVQPSQMRTNAQQLTAIVGNGALITTWSSDVMHMFLYSNLENMISVPDLALARHLDSKRVQEDLEATIQQATAQGRNVYFYGLFDERSGGPSDIYETRFRLRGFTDFLRSVERKTRPVARLAQPGGDSVVLYVYVP